MAVLKIEHLSKKFGEHTVLKDISLTVEKGEVVSIIGPSGSGKSTLLRCATLLETMDSGELAYGDLRLFQNGQYAPQETLKRARRRFGLVFQNFNLFPHYTVLQNLTDAPRTVLHRPKAEVMAAARQWLTRIGLEDRGDAYPCQLSGGQQQRVAIARALMLEPDMLFFDEPTSALDPELTAGILKVIRQLAEAHMTMVIVTHEILFARNVSDRIVFMADGTVVEEGDAKSLVDHPQRLRTQNFLANMGKK